MERCAVLSSSTLYYSFCFHFHPTSVSATSRTANPSPNFLFSTSVPASTVFNHTPLSSGADAAPESTNCDDSISFPKTPRRHPPLSSSSSSSKTKPKLDKTGRFSSPRAAREHALLIAYAACLEGSDPVRLFERRLNARRESGYEFDKSLLLGYNHMSFGGPPLSTDTVEEADKLMGDYENESAIEAAVLSAPPKLVYSKPVLRFTRKLLVAVKDKWDNHVLIIDKHVPKEWKNVPTGRILELCILHLAISEITELGTQHQFVVNEAVDLAKRFCDGTAPRIINGCLRTFVRNLEGNEPKQAVEVKHNVAG